MTDQITYRDWELLSAYLDGQISPKERQRIESRLKSDASLRAALAELQRTKAVLHSTGRLRAPRNFTLSPQVIRQQARPPGRAYPAFRLAWALASLLLVIVLLGDLLTGPRQTGSNTGAPAVSMLQAVTSNPAGQASSINNGAPQSEGADNAVSKSPAQKLVQATPITLPPAPAAQPASQPTQAAAVALAVPPTPIEEPQVPAQPTEGFPAPGGSQPETAAPRLAVPLPPPEQPPSAAGAPTIGAGSYPEPTRPADLAPLLLAPTQPITRGVLSGSQQAPVEPPPPGVASGHSKRAPTPEPQAGSAPTNAQEVSPTITGPKETAAAATGAGQPGAMGLPAATDQSISPTEPEPTLAGPLASPTPEAAIPPAPGVIKENPTQFEAPIPQARAPEAQAEPVQPPSAGQNPPAGGNQSTIEHPREDVRLGLHLLEGLLALTVLACGIIALYLRRRATS